MHRVRGFTLIELMVVVAVVAVLATVAFNSYGKQVRKSRRAEAQQVLSDLALKQEKYRSNNTTYGTIPQIGGASAAKFYDITLAAGSNTATGYIINAAPKLDQINDTCGTMRIQMASGVFSKSPTTVGCW